MSDKVEKFEVGKPISTDTMTYHEIKEIFGEPIADEILKQRSQAPSNKELTVTDVDKEKGIITVK